MAGGTYEVTLRLRDLDDLFVAPKVSPMSDDYHEYSYLAGLEFISDELYANPSISDVKATVLLPANRIHPGLEQRAKEGVERYCRGRLKYIEHDMNAIRWRGYRMLSVAFVALFVFIGASKLVYSQASVPLQVVSEGLAVAGWVALWFPLEALTVKLWQQHLDKRVYKAVKNMEITVRAAD